MNDREAWVLGQHAFAASFGGVAEAVYAAPGRVNLMGEHTDYQQGLCLPAAIDRHTVVAARRRTDRRVVAYSRAQGRWASGMLGDLHPGPRGWWFNYVAGVCEALAPPLGCDLALVGDLPVGAGLSSSASLEMAVGTAINDLFGLGMPAERLALVGQRAENAFAGVSTGIMDQFACALGREGMALLLDTRTRTADPIPFHPEESGLTLLVVDTQVARELVHGGYEARVREAQEAAYALGLTSLRDADLSHLALEGVLLRRARHICTENERVRAVVAAASRQAWDEVGQAFYASHQSLREDYEVSHPALDRVVETAMGCPSVLGARLTGAGFGGAAIVLLDQRSEGDFRQALAAAWQEDAPFRAWCVHPSQGAHRVGGERNGKP